jgi:hypothetical protein
MTATPQTPGPRSGGILSLGFWLMLGFAGLCILSAVVFVWLAPKFAVTPAARTATAVAAPTPAAATPPPADAPAYPPGTLEDRVARLEVNQKRVLDAAQAALAVSTLADAASGSRPFVQELNLAMGALATAPAAADLTVLAAKGAPSRAELAQQLETLSPRIVLQAQKPGAHASFWDQFAYAFGHVVTVSRIDPVGRGPDAALARARKLARAGDIAGADTELSHLADSPALAAWRADAQRRVDIDTRMAALRDWAATQIAAARRGEP